MKPFLVMLCLLIPLGSLNADEKTVEALLKREVVTPRQAEIDVQEYTDAKIPRLKKFTSEKEWQSYATDLRKKVLNQVVYRGKAAEWQKGKTNVVWLDTIKGGEGYQIRKLRYEAVPGLWVPALLYEPLKLKGRVPVVMNVNGHDGNGKRDLQADSLHQSGKAGNAGPQCRVARHGAASHCGLQSRTHESARSVWHQWTGTFLSLDEARPRCAALT